MPNIKLAKVTLIGLVLVIVVWTRAESARQSDKLKDLEHKAALQPGNAALQSQLGVAYFYKARLGDAQAVDRAIGILQQAAAAVPAEPDSARWLGLSYLVKVSLLSRSGAAPGEVVAAAQHAAQAFESVLERSPKDALALSSHGFALTIEAGFKRSPDLFTKGVGEMNQAVSVDPSDINPRLLRAFAILNFPVPFRDLKAARDDLTTILKGVPAGYNDRAAAVLHVYLGDVYTESREPALARAEYEVAAGMHEPGAEVARARLAAMEQGQPGPDDIQRYRASANNCTVCHSK